MNRTDLQRLAEDRVRDAEALLNAGQWSGAYYLAGYAVECGLKACIAKLTKPDDYPDKEFVQKCYTHNLDTLIKLAGLVVQRDAHSVANAAFGTNWQIVKDWNEQARYQRWPEPQARRFYQAVADATDGVLPWITARW